MKPLINIIQENNWVIITKKGKSKLPLFCGNGEREITIYDRNARIIGDSDVELTSGWGWE